MKERKKERKKEREREREREREMKIIDLAFCYFDINLKIDLEFTKLIRFYYYEIFFHE
jgi:hypothetical protein